MFKTHKNLWLWISGILLFSSFMISYESTTVPEWRIRVVNEKGELMSNIAVIQRWRDGSLEWGSEHTNTLYSDSNGYVTFPARTVDASVFRRFCGVANRAIGVVNSVSISKPYAFVSAPRNGFFMYVEGRELTSELVIEE